MNQKGVTPHVRLLITHLPAFPCCVSLAGQTANRIVDRNTLCSLLKHSFLLDLCFPLGEPDLWDYSPFFSLVSPLPGLLEFYVQIQPRGSLRCAVSGITSVKAIPTPQPFGMWGSQDSSNFDEKMRLLVGITHIPP